MSAGEQQRVEADKEITPLSGREQGDLAAVLIIGERNRNLFTEVSS